MQIEHAGAGARRTGAHALNEKPTLHALMQAGLRRPNSHQDWSAVSSGATIVMTPDGRPIRNPITGRQVRVTGSYASRKAGRALVHESMNEHAFFQHCEVDISVVDYLSQPCRFEFVIGGVKRAYIADCVRRLHNGLLEIVEVKHDRRALLDPDYAEKLQWVQSACEALGWSFRVVYGAPLRERTTRNANVRLIQQCRFARYAARDTFVVQEVLAAANAGQALGRVAEALKDPVRGRAQLCAMMVGRQVAIDLEAPLSNDSMVSALEFAGALAGEIAR